MDDNHYKNLIGDKYVCARSTLRYSKTVGEQQNE